MDYEWDPVKRALTLESRQLDMDRVAEVFAGDTYTEDDDRRDYGEKRHFTVGWLDGRMVVVVWTLRGETCRVISLRKANGREQEAFGRRLGRPG